MSCYDERNPTRIGLVFYPKLILKAVSLRQPTGRFLNSVTRVLGIVLSLSLVSGCPPCPDSPSLTVEDLEANLVGHWEGGGSDPQKVPSYTYPATMHFSENGTFSLSIETETGSVLVSGKWGVDPDALPETRIDLAVGCSDFELYPPSSLLHGIYRLRINPDDVPEHLTLKLTIDPAPVPEGFEIGDFNWTFVNPELIE